MFVLALYTAPADTGDAPPWWFLASIVVAILAIGVFTLLLATKKSRRRRTHRACPSCGGRAQPGWIRCPNCGEALGAQQPTSAAPAVAAAPAPLAAPHFGPAQIEFKSGPLTGRTFPLERDVTTVGSVDGNSIVLNDTGVSRKHVGIRKIDGGFELADLGSTNGVFVNGEKTARRRLVAGDLIRVGTSEALFRA
ncbi:MAG: FHA domain-containing protein [Polyangia bacterium]